jgi:hypothetical protein
MCSIFASFSTPLTHHEDVADDLRGPQVLAPLGDHGPEEGLPARLVGAEGSRHRLQVTCQLGLHGRVQAVAKPAKVGM